MPFDRSRLPAPHTLLAGGFALSGVLHFVAPKLYESIVPARLPRKRELVYASGVAELAAAGGLVAGAAWAAPLATATLLAVWPANIDMAVVATRQRKSKLVQAALWARVPLQLPMIKAALSARRAT